MRKLLTIMLLVVGALQPMAYAADGWLTGVKVASLFVTPHPAYKVLTTPTVDDRGFSCTRNWLDIEFDNASSFGSDLDGRRAMYDTLLTAIKTDASVNVYVDEVSGTSEVLCYAERVEIRQPPSPLSTVPPPPPDSDPNADPLDDFALEIPSNCPTEIQVCVRDHSCEDGDEVRVSVNGSVVYEGEIFSGWSCRTASVRRGDNLVDMLALNEWGHERNCARNDVNTGEIRISARGGASNSQSWRNSGGTGSRATLTVNVGASGGSCDFATLPISQAAPPTGVGE